MIDLSRRTLLVTRLPHPRIVREQEAELPLRRIAAAASTLDERLRGLCEPIPGSDPSSTGERLTRWRERLDAKAGKGAFHRRLRWDGWSLSDVRASLGPVRLRDGVPLPAWAEIVGDILRALRAASTDSSDVPTHVDALLHPLIVVARGRVEWDAGIADAAWAELEDALLRTLAADFAEAIAVERAAFRSIHPIADEAAFVARMRRGGMESLLLRYPVLARIAATRIAHWVESTFELVRRLAVDRVELRRVFGRGARLGDVVAIATRLSDPHRGGRTVMVLTFASGTRVVYKPRSLSVDVAFDRLRTWIAEDGGPRLRVPWVIDRGAYGWAEHVAPRRWRTPAQRTRYHERAGMLLCLAWLLGGSDHHARNVVARGAHPVLLDLEVMFGTPLESTDASHANVAAAYATWGSVLRTHLLPNARPGDPADLQAALDPSGDGDADAILDGFTRMYRLLLRRRDELLAPEGPLAAFADRPVRAVLRHTRIYQTLVERLRHPRFLADGAERSLEIEALCTPLLRSLAKPPGWAAYRAERRDLEALDVPVFTARADSDELRGSLGDPVPGVRRRAGYREALLRLREMGEAGLALQLDVIRSALLPRATPGEATHAADALTPASALAEAIAIADRLAATALPAGDGVRWLAVLAASDPRRARFGYTDESTEDGAGIALFLAACARETGSTAYGDLAARALVPNSIARDAADGARIDLSWKAPSPSPDSISGITALDRDELDGGRFGEVDALITSGEMEAARALAMDAMRKARKRGAYVLGPDDVFAPGLLHGLAGIGYTLLRLHAPERFPAVLR